jgi:hypothetical protein
MLVAFHEPVHAGWTLVDLVETIQDTDRVRSMLERTRYTKRAIDNPFQPEKTYAAWNSPYKNGREREKVRGPVVRGWPQ